MAVGQGEEPHQASRFQLTRTDFPTLGSEKNPDLRPQQSKCSWDWHTGCIYVVRECTWWNSSGCW